MLNYQRNSLMKSGKIKIIVIDHFLYCIMTLIIRVENLAMHVTRITKTKSTKVQ